MLAATFPNMGRRVDPCFQAEGNQIPTSSTA
jgi:hypothetical protein